MRAVTTDIIAWASGVVMRGRRRRVVTGVWQAASGGRRDEDKRRAADVTSNASQGQMGV